MDRNLLRATDSVGFPFAKAMGRFARMAFTLPPLPYAADALAPHISAETFEYHHGKHHKTYVDKLNELTNGEKGEGDLEAVILEAKTGTPLFNNAAQHWNHSFFWRCMTPGGGGTPEGELAEALARDFGSVDTFLDEFTTAATEQFGSGWAWLAHDGSKLQIMQTSNADLPLAHGAKALLTIDVWEHAYYIDHRNARPEYIEAWLANVVDWDHVTKGLADL
jgi:Fe-Mn family superoxide dismutase